MPSIKRWQNVLLWCLHNIPSARTNPTGLYLQTHTSTERSSWIEESSHTRGSKGNDEWKTSTKIILGWSGEHDHPFDESLHNIRSVWYYPLLEFLWQETRLIPHYKIRLYCIRTCSHEKRQKLDPKSKKCILVGYSIEQKVYKYFNPSTKKVQVSRDVVFDELASWYKSIQLHPTQSKLILT